MDISEEILHRLKDGGVDFFTTYPCAKIQRLYNLIHDQFLSIGVTKEEEGVGICAGASLVGANSAMLIQSTGFGNMLNALCSLTITYKLPLLILASWRGVYQETIPAQIPLGENLPALFKAIGFPYQIVKNQKDLGKVTAAINKTYQESTLQVLLLSPQLWGEIRSIEISPKPTTRRKSKSLPNLPQLSPGLLTRFDILKAMIQFLDKKLIISNIGLPSRELFHLYHQDTNFYMLGSLGLVSSIGLGVALHSSKQVVVIDGDGSLLSNLGSLATIAQAAPKNLTILAIDNGVHGSTGNQMTSTSTCVDLAKTAHGLGIRHVFRGYTLEEIQTIVTNLTSGPNFVHIPAQPGNAQVPTIPLTPHEIKELFMQAVQSS
ncbi:MAG: sulfopyruvate decarboxylase subunit alpha [Candidatus Odinarchaeota archaeon]